MNGSIKIHKNTSIDFRTALSKYTMPYEYLLFFYTDTDYKDFSMDLAKKVQETEIVIALQDNVTTTKMVDTVKEEKVISPSTYQAKHGYDWKQVSQTTTITETCNTSIEFTYIDTWFVKTYYESSYSEAVLNMGDKEEITINLPGVVTENTSSSTTSPKEIDSGSDIGVYYESFIDEYGTVTLEERQYQYEYKINQKITTDTYTIFNQYDKGEANEPKGKVEVFIDLYKKHSMAGRLREEWFFDILENNEKTANLVDLTKYLIFKATNVSYGIVEYDFSVFDISKFNDIGSMGGLSLLIEYLHQWENASGPKTNADGTKYIIETDGYGNPTVGYGVDIFNGGFAKIFEQAGYPTHIGGEVDKEFVDALEQQELQGNLEAVRSATSGLNLTEYQIHALVSRAYNCGIAGAITYTRGSPALNFVNSYNKYWNAETDDLYEERNNKADFNHTLYKQYMSVPVTAKTENGPVYSKGLENRRKSEWTLFQTGYYDRIDKWYQEGGDIIAVADLIHKYMEENNYIYCVYGSNSYEECGKFGKSHGLDSTFEKSKTGHQKTCCATYVSWVLQETGHITASDHTNGATAMKDALVRNGWTKVNSVSELQPGDVLYYSYGHVEIYAGDGKVYNAGSGNAIRGASPQTKGISSMTFGLRAPN